MSQFIKNLFLGRGRNADQAEPSNDPPNEAVPVPEAEMETFGNSAPAPERAVKSSEFTPVPPVSVSRREAPVLTDDAFSRQSDEEELHEPADEHTPAPISYVVSDDLLPEGAAAAEDGSWSHRATGELLDVEQRLTFLQQLLVFPTNTSVVLVGEALREEPRDVRTAIYAMIEQLLPVSDALYREMYAANRESATLFSDPDDFKAVHAVLPIIQAMAEEKMYPQLALALTQDDDLSYFVLVQVDKEIPVQTFLDRYKVPAELRVRLLESLAGVH